MAEKKVKSYLLCVILIAASGSGHTPVFSGIESMEIILRTEVQVDLFFHCLAHMDIGEDASNLYSEAYIARIAREKRQSSSPRERRKSW
ncbi:MAG: hypothetical protein WBC70_05275 [Candidatus Aminicenantales bacterium]